jgi:hypothetical protein
MSALSQTVRGLRNLWGHADDEDYAQDEVDTPTIKTIAPPNRSAITAAAAPATALTTTLNLNPGIRWRFGHARSTTLAPGAVTFALASCQEYLHAEPKSQDDAAIAADALKPATL